MRHSEFWALCDDVFGAEYSRTLARELALNEFQSRSATEALAAGEPARDVWHALCDQMSVPLTQRDGGDPQRTIPPRR